MANVNALLRDREALTERIANLVAETRGFERSIRDLNSRLAVTVNTTERQNISRRIQDLQARVNTNQATIRDLEAQLANVNRQLGSAQAPGPVASAGQVVKENQDARGSASIQNPTGPIARPAGPGISNATPVPTTPTTGTNAPTRRLESTQVIPPPTASQPLPGSLFDLELGNTGTIAGTGDPTAQDDSPRATPTVSRAATSPGDDSGAGANGTASNEVQTLANRFTREIVPRPNVLDKYSSYTYSISVYLMSPEAYAGFVTNKTRTLNGSNLLMQSAGAPVGDRNQEFPLDFYIDDVEIKLVAPGKGTMQAHNATEMTFTVYEPNGITFIQRLYAATQKYIASEGSNSQSTRNNNYAAQNYLMVIRFYGYDELGNLITEPGTYDGGNKTDATAIVEKFIPFQFTSIKFRIANRITEYSCHAVTPQVQIAQGQARAVIPFNIELTATTLKNLLGATTATSSTQAGAANAPEKANAAPSPTAVSGLAEALNRYQDELVSQGIYTYADRYKFIISHAELANASVVPPGPVNKKYTPNIVANTPGQAKDANQQSVNNNAKTSSSLAGQSIVAFLDLAVRSTDYITKQQNKIKGTDENGKPVDIPQSGTGNGMAWYKIGMQAKPISDKIDPKRGDYAYEITYEIAPYGITDMKSEYFPKGRFRGTQKRYAYWFTGENTSVLDFSQDYNYLYYIVVNSPQAPVAAQGTPNYHEVEKRNFAPASGQSNMGAEDGVFEPAANAADYLYSPGDQARVRLSIVGDPAWIQQGELVNGVRSTGTTAQTGTSSTDPFFDAFLPDGTINFDSQEALFELSWNLPADWNLYTGVMDIQGSSQS